MDGLRKLHGIKARELILNGDVLDSLDCRRLKRTHWDVLSAIRDLSKKVGVIWVRGNHDGPAETLSHLLGVEVVDEYVFETGGKKCLVIHGDRFDSWIEEHPVLTAVADTAYGVLQGIDPTHGLAKQVKHASKTFLRICDAVKQGACKYAYKLGVDIVCCGHTHFAEVERDKRNILYANSGCWTERPCSYLVVRNGKVKLKRVS